MQTSGVFPGQGLTASKRQVKPASSLAATLRSIQSSTPPAVAKPRPRKQLNASSAKTSAKKQNPFGGLQQLTANALRSK